MEKHGFQAVFIGTGAGLPLMMDIPGQEPQGRLQRQRVPDPHQPDEGVPVPGSPDAAAAGHAASS